MMKRMDMNIQRYICLATVCALTCGLNGWGQSGTRRPRVVERNAPPAPAKPANATKKQPPVQKEEAKEQPAPKPAEPPKPTIDPNTVGKFQQIRPELALGGHDAVVLQSTEQLTPGSPQHETFFDGQVYRFTSRENLERFKESPATYVPALGGLSVVALHDRYQALPGKTDHFSSYGNRIYLFSTADEKETFDSAPGVYFDADVLMDGFSPVSLVDEEVLRRGDKQFMVICDGRRVYLTSEEELQAFQKDPGKYYPVLGGLDPVSLVKEAPAPGVARLSAVYKNRLYMFSSDANRDEFLANPVPYADLQVAFGGNCPVTRIDENKTQPGHYAISVIYRGMRIVFASKPKRDHFLQEPRRYDKWPAGDANKP